MLEFNCNAAGFAAEALQKDQLPVNQKIKVHIGLHLQIREDDS